MHEHRVLRLGRARDVDAVLAVRARDAADRQARDHSHGGMHRSHDLGTNAGEGGLELPHPVHQLLHLADIPRDFRHIRVHTERPLVLLLNALVKVTPIRPVAANHIKRFALHVVLELEKLHRDTMFIRKCVARMAK